MTVKRLKRWLYLGHRWLGIVTCLLFATWFISGLVMMYVGFPTLEETERRAALPSLDWERVRLSPDEALASAGEARFPQDLRLAMLDRLPIYRITGWDGSRRTLSAVDGRAIPAVEATAASAIAGHDPRAVRPVDLGTVGRDQWSVTARYDPLRPFHLVALGDPEGTRLYVSVRAGEVALDTTSRERFWNWVGAIPHWIYLTPLRAQAELWRDVVLWVSGVSIAAVVSGFWIGLLRVRVRRRYRDGRPTPYRGWMAWHHLAGTVGSLTLLTFIVSGWLSMSRDRWFASPVPSQATLERYAGVSEPRFNLGLSELRGGVCPDAVEVRFRHVGGVPLVQAACRDGRTVTCCEVGGLSQQRLAGAIGRLMPEAGPARITLLTGEDAYWYGHHQTVLLPVLRAVFSDPDGTWFHIIPTTGEVLSRTDRRLRLYRWLFNGLHSWDYGFLIRRRPAWDLVVWALALLGLVVSVSGIVIGWRRLRKRNAGSASA